MSKNSEYAAKYADAAMEQMKRYGIPASVTLAQGILESRNGQSELSQLGNNHFGIKATKAWLNAGGDYLVYDDDKPNEKFCKYNSVADSYEHHSKFLANGTRYAQCFKLSPDDYKGWTKGIERAGYATNGGYAKSLQSIIEANNLQKYDQQVMTEMREQGKNFGVENNPRQTTAMSSFPNVENASSVTVSQSNSQNTSQSASQSAANTESKNLKETGEYSFPVSRKDFLFITSPFGMRQDPMDKSKQQMHKGIDIRTNHEAVLATESNGKVVSVNQNTNTAGGKSVTVEYNRNDGSKVQCTYMHLDSIAVKQGDTVKVGQKLGISGNTGTRTTGEHLHFGVKTIAADGTKRDIDPAVYLAEIAQKGNIQLQAMHNGTDLLAKYKTDVPVSTEPMEQREESRTCSSYPESRQRKTEGQQLSPEAWMKKLLSSEDASVGLSSNNDPILEMAMTTFSSLMLLATQIDNKTENEKNAAISEAVNQKKIDLSGLGQGMKSCSLTIADNGKAVLQADNGSVQINKELTSAELSKLSATLNNSDLSDETKRMRIAGMVSGIVLSQQASQNFEQGMSEEQSRQESMKR
jgi:murein DD-endopeptidase MepM/ murein hydrolase activator NlpD